MHFSSYNKKPKFLFHKPPTHTRLQALFKSQSLSFSKSNWGACICLMIKNYLQILNTYKKSAGQTYFVLQHNKPTLFCSTTNLLCSAAQKTYFVLQHNKPSNHFNTIWNCPYRRSDCRRCTILWSMLKVKCSLGGPLAVTFTAVTATVLFNGVRGMKCQLSFVGWTKVNKCEECRISMGTDSVTVNRELGR